MSETIRSSFISQEVVSDFDGLEQRFERVPECGDIKFYDASVYTKDEINPTAICFELSGMDSHGQCQVLDPQLVIVSPGDLMPIGVNSRTGKYELAEFTGETLDKAFLNRLELYLYAAYQAHMDPNYQRLASWRQFALNTALNKFGWRSGVEIVDDSQRSTGV